MSNRFTRQERLAEVGEHGQTRLLNGQAQVPDDASGVLAALYLERAGVGTIARDAAGARPFAHRAAFHHGAALELGAGAWHALSEILRLLGRDPA